MNKVSASSNVLIGGFIIEMLTYEQRLNTHTPEELPASERVLEKHPVRCIVLYPLRSPRFTCSHSKAGIGSYSSKVSIVFWVGRCSLSFHTWYGYLPWQLLSNRLHLGVYTLRIFSQDINLISRRCWYFLAPSHEPPIYVCKLYTITIQNQSTSSEQLLGWWNGHHRWPRTALQPAPING